MALLKQSKDFRREEARGCSTCDFVANATHCLDARDIKREDAMSTRGPL